MLAQDHPYKLLTSLQRQDRILPLDFFFTQERRNVLIVNLRKAFFVIVDLGKFELIMNCSALG